MLTNTIVEICSTRLTTALRRLDEANEKIKRLIAENKASQIKINYLKISLERKNKYNAELQQSISYIRKSKYSYENLKLKPAIFEYLVGLSVGKFDILYNIVSPYMHTIKYPDCKGTGERCIDKATELLSVLTICRHSLHLGIMAYILNIGKSTVYSSFVGCIVFLETLFNELDLKPDD